MFLLTLFLWTYWVLLIICYGQCFWITGVFYCLWTSWVLLIICYVSLMRNV